MKNTYQTPATKQIKIAPQQLTAATNNIDSNGTQMKFNKGSISQGDIDDAV